MSKIVNVEHETHTAEIIWIDRMSLNTGKVTGYTAPVAPWGDPEALVRAARVIFRLSWS